MVVYHEETNMIKNLDCQQIQLLTITQIQNLNLKLNMKNFKMTHFKCKY